MVLSLSRLLIIMLIACVNGGWVDHTLSRMLPWWQHKRLACGRDAAKRFARDGFIVCPDLFNSTELLAMRREVASIARGERGIVHGLQTDEQAAQCDDDELIGRYLAFHHPHKLSGVLRDALRHHRLVAVLQEILGTRDVKCMQSM